MRRSGASSERFREVRRDPGSTTKSRRNSAGPHSFFCCDCYCGGRVVVVPLVADGVLVEVPGEVVTVLGGVLLGVVVVLPLPVVVEFVPLDFELGEIVVLLAPVPLALVPVVSQPAVLEAVVVPVALAGVVVGV